MKITEWNEKHKEYLPVGDGWRPLVEKLVDDIAKIDPEVEVTAVKEKFGGLRFYVYSASEASWELIRKAEEASYSICEECGKPSKLRSKAKHGWIYNRCSKCWKKLKKELL